MNSRWLVRHLVGIVFVTTLAGCSEATPTPSTCEEARSLYDVTLWSEADLLSDVLGSNRKGRCGETDDGGPAFRIHFDDAVEWDEATQQDIADAGWHRVNDPDTETSEGALFYKIVDDIELYLVVHGFSDGARGTIGVR